MPVECRGTGRLPRLRTRVFCLVAIWLAPIPALAASTAPAYVDPVYRDAFEAFACTAGDDPHPNEGLFEEPGVGGCADGMVPVASFCIDRYEAALLDVTIPAAPVAWSPYRNPGTTAVRAVSARFAIPQGTISGDQAAAACQAAGKRLCSNSEWLRACQGPDMLTFPYGNTRLPGVCNDARSTHPVADYFGTPGPWTPEQLQHPCINQQWNTVDRAGANAQCVSAEGPYDMMGNLNEWTSDPAGTYRGGFYLDTQINGNGCLYLTTAHDTEYFDYSTGFRCCADP
ncbi:SUMF1/EgtB/PvdO family nonheme iron enzyme [Dokdonella immobilis]|uniref:Sulfatase-modifying factor enzyme 1 n=1 Tax=Dokdonella immobilis TaxID=578942 RepID=A0A1I4WAX6_9GAMM|nr:SUMF1/EgtB/PvdO family nonheme iron enzyme [Dokdonella immobilis]SFN10079.1 Sulfatase-modifying factor enzyme 1 [Dokdonella immobilis]